MVIGRLLVWQGFRRSSRQVGRKIWSVRRLSDNDAYTRDGKKFHCSLIMTRTRMTHCNYNAYTRNIMIKSKCRNVKWNTRMIRKIPIPHAHPQNERRYRMTTSQSVSGLRFSFTCCQEFVAILVCFSLGFQLVDPL